LSQELNLKTTSFLGKHTHEKWPVVEESNTKTESATVYVVFVFEGW